METIGCNTPTGAGMHAHTCARTHAYARAHTHIHRACNVPVVANVCDRLAISSDR